MGVSDDEAWCEGVNERSMKTISTRILGKILPAEIYLVVGGT